MFFEAITMDSGMRQVVANKLAGLARAAQNFSVSYKLTVTQLVDDGFFGAHALDFGDVAESDIITTALVIVKEMEGLVDI